MLFVYLSVVNNIAMSALCKFKRDVQFQKNK